MSVVALERYEIPARDVRENFPAPLLYIGWEDHLMFCAPFCLPLPPDTPFGALATAVLPRLIRDLPLSLPIVHVLFGLVLYSLVTDLPSPEDMPEVIMPEPAASSDSSVPSNRLPSSDSPAAGSRERSDRRESSS